MKKPTSKCGAQRNHAIHLLRVSYRDGSGFWVEDNGVPVAGTKRQIEALAKTLAYAGGTMKAVATSIPPAPRVARRKRKGD